MLIRRHLDDAFCTPVAVIDWKGERIDSFMNRYNSSLS